MKMKRENGHSWTVVLSKGPGNYEGTALLRGRLGGSQAMGGEVVCPRSHSLEVTTPALEPKETCHCQEAPWGDLDQDGCLVRAPVSLCRTPVRKMASLLLMHTSGLWPGHAQSKGVPEPLWMSVVPGDACLRHSCHLSRPWSGRCQWLWGVRL